VGNLQAAVVSIITLFTWGIPSQADSSDITGAISKGQILANVPELLLYAYISQLVYLFFQHWTNVKLTLP
jgi:hypothetical protein